MDSRNYVLEPLTQRELEILRLLAEGLSNREIAQKLYISYETVKWYNKQLYSKLDVHSRSQAVNRAREIGLLDDAGTTLPHGIPQLALPSGIVTFLYTDIEGSTQLLSQLREQYATLLTDQRRIMRNTFAKWNGQEVDTQGDAFFVAFPRATEAVSAVVEIQREEPEAGRPGLVQLLGQVLDYLG